MLERVPLLDKHLDDYAGVVEPATRRAHPRARRAAAGRPRAPRERHRVRRRRRRAARHPRRRCSASVGIEAEWQVIHGSDEFFAVTKTVHNALQGADVEWTTQMERIYLERVLDNALLLEGEWDFVVIHDPQPAAMLEFVARPRRRRPGARSGSGAATSTSPTPTRRCGSSSGRSSSSTTRRCGRCRSSCPRRSTMDRIVLAPPCIDPLSVKNLELPTPFVQEISQAVRRRRPTDPLVCQVSRFDPWKDPVGVIEAFRIVRERVPDAQLVLAGSMATDDPEGFHVWELTTEAARAGDRDIHLLSNIQQVGVGADQRVPARRRRRHAEVAARRLRPHRERRAVEGPAGRRRPLRRHHAADPTTASNGYLVDDVEECARAHASTCSRDPDRRRRDGRAGPRARARSNFLSTRELEDWLRLFGDLRLTRSDRRLAPRAVPVRR